MVKVWNESTVGLGDKMAGRRAWRDSSTEERGKMAVAKEAVTAEEGGREEDSLMGSRWREERDKLERIRELRRIVGEEMKTCSEERKRQEKSLAKLKEMEGVWKVRADRIDSLLDELEKEAEEAGVRRRRDKERMEMEEVEKGTCGRRDSRGMKRGEGGNRREENKGAVTRREKRNVVNRGGKGDGKIEWESGGSSSEGEEIGDTEREEEEKSRAEWEEEEGARRRYEEEKRRKNIAIKGLMIDEGKNVTEEVRKWLGRKLGVQCRVIGCTRSGDVWIARLGEESDKRDVMERRYKLRGEKEYITHDVGWEERRKREEMLRWAYDLRKRGSEIELGNNWVGIDGRWRRWIEVREEVKRVGTRSNAEVQMRGRRENRTGVKDKEGRARSEM